MAGIADYGGTEVIFWTMDKGHGHNVNILWEILMIFGDVQDDCAVVVFGNYD